MIKYEDNVSARINGNNLQPLQGASVTVTRLDNGLSAPLYSDNGVTPLAQPLTTDNNGYFGFYAADGKYVLTFSSSRFATFTRQIVLEDPLDNPYATKADLAAGTGATLVSHNGETIASELEALQLADYPALRAYAGLRKNVYVTGTGIAGMFVRDDADTAVLATPANAAFSVAAGTLAAGTYYYRVSATDGYGETLASTETSIAVPAQLSAPVNAAFTTATTGGTLAAGTYYYRVSAINAVGETLASTETSIATTGTTSTVTVNWGAVTGATGYKVYGRTTGAELLMATLGAVTTWTDTGSVTPAGALPASNTTSGGVTVNWSAVTNATGYKVYGRTTGAELLMATLGNVTTWADNGSVTPAGALPTGYKKDNGGTIIEATNGKRWKRPSNEAVSVMWFGAKGDGITDDTAATQAALNAGARKVRFPAGSYAVSAMLVTPTSVSIDSDGVNVTTLKAIAGFVGSTLLRAGHPTTPYAVPNVSMSGGITIDLQGNVDAGLTCYGLQDGSSFSNVYVRGVRKYGIVTNWCTDGTTYLMNEGVKFDNCHALGHQTLAAANGAYWSINGFYEGTFVGCKGMGFAPTTHTNMYAWAFGMNNTAPGRTGVQGVVLENCSAANMYGIGNAGLFMDSALWVRDHEMTYENVQGPAVIFGTNSIFNSVMEPRVYNPAADATVFPTHFVFQGAANNNKVKGVYTTSNPTTFVDFQGTSSANAVEYLYGDYSNAAFAAKLKFTSANYNNRVTLMGDGTGIKREQHFAANQYEQVVMANGCKITCDQYNLALEQGAGKGVKIFDSNGKSRFELDNSGNVKVNDNTGTYAFLIDPNGRVLLNPATIKTSSANAYASEIWLDTVNGNTLKMK